VRLHSHLHLGGRSLSVALLLLASCRQIVGIEERRVTTTEGAVEACGLPTQSGSCAACIARECCDEAADCADDPSCLTEESCLRSCTAGDATCQLTCSERWDPVSVRARLVDCRRDSCASSCGSWDCVGHGGPPTPALVPETITISARVACSTCNSINGSGPSEGVRVRACLTSDPRCSAELASDLSDPEGNVALELETGGTPLSIFLEFHKQDWVDTVLLLNTPPLSFPLDVGVVLIDQRESIDRLAADIGTTYDPELALVKVRVNDCNLESSAGTMLDWGDAGAATISSLSAGNSWDAIAVNIPVPANLTTRLVARLATPEAPVVAVANLVVRRNTVTLAPFMTPTP
jgi:hypothetical protein